MTPPPALRSALVTGASSGIGRAIALGLTAAGTRVIATGRDADALRRLADAAPDIHLMAGDLRDGGFVADLTQQAADVDLLVNNAGTLKHAPFLDSSPAEWEAVFGINVLALMAVTQPIARAMAARGHGQIVLLSSLLARRVAPYTTVYAASKHAVAAIAQGLRAELGPRGVRVLEVAPGLVRTNIMRDVTSAEVQGSYETKQFPWLTPEQVADAVLHAVSAPATSCYDLIEVRPHGQF